jgi:hypothetical protein
LVERGVVAWFGADATAEWIPESDDGVRKGKFDTDPTMRSGYTVYARRALERAGGSRS